jgi:hypothetical protein
MFTTAGAAGKFPALLISALMWSALQCGHAAEAAAPATRMTQRLTHLYSDEQGVSHFRDEDLVVESGAPGPAQRALSQAAGGALLALKRGAKEDWHRPPRRMYLVALTGMSEVTAGDGSVRRFGPGSLLLMEDLAGKGHITRAVGKVDHIALVFPADTP